MLGLEDVCLRWGMRTPLCVILSERKSQRDSLVEPVGREAFSQIGIYYENAIASDGDTPQSYKVEACIARLPLRYNDI